MMSRLLLLIVPIVGWSVTFQEFSERVYENAVEKMENDLQMKTVSYSKNIALSTEPVNLGFSSRRIRADDSANNGYEYSVMSEWTFKLPHLKEAQSNEWELIRKNFAERGNILRRIIDVDVKHEWLRYDAAMQRASIYDEKVRISEKGYESGKKQHSAGRMSRMELMRLESEFLRAKEEFQKAQMEAEHVQHVLREKGMSHEAVQIDNVRFEYIHDYDKLFSFLDASPSIEFMRMKIEELDAQIKSARQSRIESITLGVGMTQEPTQNSLDVSVNIPISWQDRHENTIALLMSQRSSMEHQKKNTLDKLRLGVEAMSEHLKEREEMIRQSDAVHQHYQTLFLMAQKAFEGGVMSQFEYLAAKSEYFNARLRSIDLREEYIDEMYEIENRLGGIVQ